MALKDKYVTISEAAKIAGVTRQTISRWVAEDKIPVEKVGREALIKKTHLAKYIGEQTVMQMATQIVNDIIVRIQEEYGYTDEDKVEYRDFDRRNTFLFSVTRKDGTREMVRFIIDRVKRLDNKNKHFLIIGYKVPIKKIERSISKE